MNCRILIFSSIIVGLLFGCKPRGALSGLTDNATPEQIEENFKRAQAERLEAVEMQAFIGTLQMGAPFITEQLVEKQKNGDLKMVEAPQGCGNQFKNDLGWYHPTVYSIWQKGREHQSLFVRLNAIQVIAQIANFQRLTCGRQVVERMVVQGFRAKAPPEEYIFKGEDGERKPPSEWYCNSYLTCNQAIDTLVYAVESFPNGYLWRQYLQKIQTSIDALDVDPTVWNVLDYRLQTLLAQTLFFEKSAIKSEEGIGRIKYLDMQEIAQIEKIYFGLVTDFDGYYRAVASDHAIDNEFKPRIRYELIRGEILGNATLSWEGLEDEQKELLSDYVNSIIQSALDLRNANAGYWIYVSRLKNADPGNWIEHQRKRLSVYETIRNETARKARSAARQARASADSDEDNDSEDNEGSDGSGEFRGLTDEEIVQIYRNNELDPEKPGDKRITPDEYMLALIAHGDYEALMPFRTEWREEIEWAIKEVKDARPYMNKLRNIRGVYSALANQVMSFSDRVTNGEFQFLEELSKEERENYDKARGAFDTLIKYEPDIVKSKDFQGFHSVLYQQTQFGKHMFGRVVQLNEWIDSIKKETFKERMNRILWDPGSGIEMKQQDLDWAHARVMEDWLVIRCVAHMWEGGGNTSRKRIKEKFFIDETEIDFECKGKGEEDYGQLRMRVSRWSGDKVVQGVKDRMAEAIYNHPFLHTAVVIAVGPLMGAAGAVVSATLNVVSKIGTIAMRMVQAARMFYRYTHLIVQSWLFGVMEPVAHALLGKLVGLVYGVKKPSSHGAGGENAPNPLWNVEGMIMGAIIFAAIPMAHHAASRVVGAFFRNGSKYTARTMARMARQSKGLTVSMTRGQVVTKWAYHVTNQTAMWAAETSMFAMMPIVLNEPYEEFKQRWKGEYIEPTEFDEVMKLRYGQTMAEGLITSAITAGAFSVNRMSGELMRHSSYPNNLRSELNFYRVKTLDALGKLAGKKQLNAYEILGLDRTASNRQIRQAHREKMDAIEAEQLNAQLTGYKNSDRANYARSLRARRIEAAYGLLTAGSGSKNFVADNFKFSNKAEHDAYHYKDREGGKDKREPIDHDYLWSLPMVGVL